ncbi:MAG: DUF4097 family beta strand repeat-containing protein [Pirellulales bacterium]
MVRFFMMTCWIGLALASVSGCNKFSSQASQTFSSSTPVSGPITLELEGVNGGIEVVGADNIDTVEVTAKAKVYAMSKEAAESWLPSLEPTVELRGDTLTVVSNPRVRNAMASVSFQVIVPRGSLVKASTSNGAIEIIGTRSEVAVKTSNGRVVIEDAKNKIEAKTSNGSIALKRTEGPVDLSTSNGRIKIDSCSLRGDSKVRTSNGSVELMVHSNTPMQLSAHTSNGRIQCDRSIQLDESRKNHVEGRIGGGDRDRTDGSIHIKTSNGSITIDVYSTTSEPEPEVTSTGGIQVS